MIIPEPNAERNGEKRVIPQGFEVYPDQIPDVLKQDDCWMCCNRDKEPMVAIPSPTKRASSTDPKTWRSYGEALAVVESGRWPCLGRAIQDGEGLVGLDFDKCRDPQTGKLDEWARKSLELLNSYSEVSPSLSGVKGWCPYSSVNW